MTYRFCTPPPTILTPQPEFLLQKITCYSIFGKCFLILKFWHSNFSGQLHEAGVCAVCSSHSSWRTFTNYVHRYIEHVQTGSWTDWTYQGTCTYLYSHSWTDHILQISLVGSPEVNPLAVKLLDNWLYISMNSQTYQSSLNFHEPCFNSPKFSNSNLTFHWVLFFYFWLRLVVLKMA